MKSSFSFADLIPETLTYRDDVLGGDGTVYAVQVRDLLSTAALVEFQRIDEQIRSLKQNVQNDGGAERIDSLTDQMLAVLIPKLPTERRQVIPLILRIKFLEWWQQAHGVEVAEATTLPDTDVLAAIPNAE